MQVRALIRDLGGRHAVAEITGATVKAISNWPKRNRIPAEHQIAVWLAAQERRLDWSPPNAERLAVVPRDRPS